MHKKVLSVLFTYGCSVASIVMATELFVVVVVMHNRSYLITDTDRVGE